ncbi:TRAP transporter small permease [Paenactinomyces guangxiensis]|uniref:TRAP transporter small permease n=1 Tax=Paenactinomyces guangxiensis TaxID=1490290 RepID=A0A7W1WNK3_9BACL|nr:TRAP transporter small permease [Paenactinomyces guangxiensis]MBA4493063.1 TRAP transporter small permease [Paenactinomyces guangxiensis]MBH8590088.1 TRAP transporter small permease [Paenactinomyces guangxiensis]
MKKILKLLNQVLNGVIVVIMAGMVSLVFLNVVLRYGFESGITWSEEMARYMFVWIVFLGAVVAVKDKSHLGVDLLIARVPRPVQKILYFISNSLVIFVLILFIDGLFKMIELNKMVSGPATGIPVAFFYLAGVVAGVLMIIISGVQTIRFVFFGQDLPDWAKADAIQHEGGKAK